MENEHTEEQVGTSSCLDEDYNQQPHHLCSKSVSKQRQRLKYTNPNMSIMKKNFVSNIFNVSNAGVHVLIDSATGSAGTLSEKNEGSD